MRFTADQVQALQRTADRDFADDLCRHLRAHDGEAVAHLGDDALREEVERGIERARAHEIRARSRVAFFVTLLFEVGPAFDEHPHVRQVLGGERRSADDRLAGLASVLSEEEWAEASRIPRPTHPAGAEKET